MINKEIKKVKVAFVFNCVEYDKSYFSDATVMAGALEESVEISIDEYDRLYSPCLNDINTALCSDIDYIQIIDSFGLVSMYDSESDIHHFFEILWVLIYCYLYKYILDF